MERLKDGDNFDRDMAVILEILERKGFVVASDHPNAHAAKYPSNVRAMRDWLSAHGYDGNVDSHDYFDAYAGTISGLYDKDRLTYKQMQKELEKEAKRQLRRR